MELNTLEALCKQIRRDIISSTAAAGSGHPGGSLSCVEMLTALYCHAMKVDPSNPQWEERDRFVLSKGHAAPALYALLANLGFFDRSELLRLRKFGSFLQGHPDKNKTPGVDASTGSLGQGISVACGMALGLKKLGTPQKVYTLIGDGESDEGMVWEALMSAAHFKLDNLTILCDWNGLQIDGTNENVMSLGDYAGKLRAFGCYVIEVQDGNDLTELMHALDTPTLPGKPRCILCHTLKGKGVSYMENAVGWHGKAPNAEQAAIALKELED